MCAVVEGNRMYLDFMKIVWMDLEWIEWKLLLCKDGNFVELNESNFFVKMVLNNFVITIHNCGME